MAERLFLSTEGKPALEKIFLKHCSLWKNSHWSRGKVWEDRNVRGKRLSIDHRVPFLIFLLAEWIKGNLQGWREGLEIRSEVKSGNAGEKNLWPCAWPYWTPWGFHWPTSGASLGPSGWLPILWVYQLHHSIWWCKSICGFNRKGVSVLLCFVKAGTVFTSKLSGTG